LEEVTSVGVAEVRFKFIEKAALSVGIILVVTPLIGLTLNYSPFGIRFSSVLASLWLLIAASAVVAIIRKRQTETKDLPYRKSEVYTRPIFYVILPVTVAVLLRVYPYLISGLPFSVDSWPSIRYAELLLGHTPVRLDDASVFGGRYDYLGEKLFGTVVSALTGLQPAHAMGFFVPFAGAFSILIFYVLVDGLYGKGVSFIASLFLATAFSDVILTAGVKGETYAHPLYLLLIFLFLNQRLGWRKKTLLFTLTSASLVLAHYYTAILTAAILASMGLGTIIIRAKEGLSLEVRSLMFPAILAGSILMYFLLYANWAFNFVSSIDWLSAASYQAVLFSLTIWLTLKPQNQKEIAFLCPTVSAAAFAFAWLATRRPLLPGAPILPAHYILYAAPFIAAAPLCVLGYGMMGKMRGEQHATPLFWLATVLGLEGYAIFGNAESGLGLTLAYRGVNFLLPPIAIISAVGVHWLHEYGRSRKAVKVGAVAVVLFIISANIYSVYAAVCLQERYMGYFWLYRLPEYRAAAWVKGAAGNQAVAGDVKTLYLLKHYFDVNVDAFQGLKYLTGDAQKPQILFIYNQMLKNGYVVYGGYSVDLPENWMEKASSLNLVYSNGLANVYVG
jgi:hypothetical protein